MIHRRGAGLMRVALNSFWCSNEYNSIDSLSHSIREEAEKGYIYHYLKMNHDDPRPRADKLVKISSLPRFQGSNIVLRTVLFVVLKAPELGSSRKCR